MPFFLVLFFCFSHTSKEAALLRNQIQISYATKPRRRGEKPQTKQNKDEKNKKSTGDRHKCFVKKRLLVLLDFPTLALRFLITRDQKNTGENRNALEILCSNFALLFFPLRFRYLSLPPTFRG